MDNLRGALLMTLAMLGFALEDMLIKLLADAFPIWQILLVLGVGGSLGFAAMILAQRQPLLTRDMLCLPITLRAIGEIIGTVSYVTAFVLASFSAASAILQIAPLLVTLGAAIFLGEQVGWRRWSAILLGLFGVLLIIRPGMAGFEPLSLLALLGAACLALRDLATRRSPATVSTLQLSFLGFAAVIPAALLLYAAGGAPAVPPSPLQWLILSGTVIIGLFAYYGIVAAMRIGDVGFVTPFRYTRIVFALIIGIAVFSEAPDALMLIGAAVVIGSGTYSVWREQRLARAT